MTVTKHLLAEFPWAIQQNSAKQQNMAGVAVLIHKARFSGSSHSLKTCRAAKYSHTLVANGA